MPARFEVKPMRSDIHTCETGLACSSGQAKWHVWLTKHASAPRDFGSSTRFGHRARCGPASLSGRFSFPVDRQYCLPILQGAGRLATSVPIFLMLFVYPTYSFAVGAVRVRICTRTPHLWARCGPLLQCLSSRGSGAGDACGGTSVPLFARCDLVAPAARA